MPALHGTPSRSFTAANGKPAIVVHGESVSGAVSGSDTETFTCAVFVAVSLPAAVASPRNHGAAATPQAVSPPQASRKPMLLSCLALAMAAGALLVSILRLR